MAKYIEREKVIDELEHLHEDAELYYLGVYDCVKSVPTADVVEVKRGKWEEKSFIVFDSEIKLGYKCSECNTTWDNKTNYCSNCGAKMDGERKCDNDGEV